MTYELLPPLLILLGIALVIVGLAGAVLPALPGLPMVFGGLWLVAWAESYAHVGAWTLGVLALLLIFGLILDFVASSLGAKRFGASPHAVGGAFVGTVVGMFFFPWGLIIGPFAGAMLGEMKARKSLEQAARSGVGTWIGLMLGIVAKLVISLIMVAIFVVQYFL